MAKSTKDKILDAAARCFNRDGMVNVRLQHIGDEAEWMSVGNLAYHYRTKEHIVQAIWERLVAEQRVLMAEFRVLPLFEDVERYLRSSFALQQRYLFFYQDTLEVMRAYPTIAEAHRKHLTWQALQILEMLRFNAARGAFQPEVSVGHFEQLAHLINRTAETWLYHQRILDLPADDFDAFRQTFWSLLLPCMTEMGRMEYFQLNALVLGKYF